VTGGIILSNISLVLQKVSRQSAGEYSCMAINTEGRGASQPIILAVKCKSLLILPGFWRTTYKLSQFYSREFFRRNDDFFSTWNIIIFRLESSVFINWSPYFLSYL
jgi:hypothetical protein